jgi:hypothetical protein
VKDSVAKHFCQKNHCVKNFKVIGIEKTGNGDKIYRETKESLWINARPMCKFAQLYACHELFLKQHDVTMEVKEFMTLISRNFVYEKSMSIQFCV